jgi:hypothetical protein
MTADRLDAETLAAIRTELAVIASGPPPHLTPKGWYTVAWANVGRHVPVLLAEVERLRRVGLSAHDEAIALAEAQLVVIDQRDRLVAAVRAFAGVSGTAGTGSAGTTLLSVLESVAGGET